VKALLVLGAPVGAAFALMLGLVVVLVPGTSSAADPGGLPQAPDAVTDVHLDQEQLRVARVVIEVARGLGVPPRGWVVVPAAGSSESTRERRPTGGRYEADAEFGRGRSGHPSSFAPSTAACRVKRCAGSSGSNPLSVLTRSSR
jgi:hypothetical protein